MNKTAFSHSFITFCRILEVRRLNEIAEKILGYLDYDDLKNAELVSTVWRQAVNEGNLWKRLLQKRVHKCYFFFTKLINVSNHVFYSRSNQVCRGGKCTGSWSRNHSLVFLPGKWMSLSSIMKPTVPSKMG